uniref:Uncharacterized protein n=1 Tax=Trichogramma kaykai TaxID=54128 RepID=A0ABD2XKY4_9HYME
MLQLNRIRDEIDWEIEEERHEFLSKFESIIVDWKGPPPDLRDIFRKSEIKCILTACAIHKDKSVPNRRGQLIIEFVALSGYKDEPKCDQNGKPLLRYTTPVHHAARRWFPNRDIVVRELFKIYDRFDVNYIDEFGFTHFHAACVAGLDDVVNRFVDLGQDLNCIDQETGDPPLHLALRQKHKKVVESLLVRGADPNLPNAEGWTSLHIICQTCLDDDLAEFFFKINDDIDQMVQVDARDNLGRTPLHLALEYGLNVTAELLLRRGADPNIADEKGLTPLHLICQEDFAETFFCVNKEKHRVVQIDAQDKCGRTPLQYAVASLLPHLIDTLLDHGADLRVFAFPDESHFDERFEALVFKADSNFKLRLASGLLSVVKHLEHGGYELDRSDALVIVKLFAKYELLNMPADLDKRWYRNEEFAREAKKIMVKPIMSLYNFVRLRPEKAEKLLSYSDYFTFARADHYWSFTERYSEACAVHLNMILCRRFLRRWALEYFYELTRYRLSIECCEIIIEQLSIEDFLHVCLAPEVMMQHHDVCENIVKLGEKKYNESKPLRGRKILKKLKDYIH